MRHVKLDLDEHQRNHWDQVERITRVMTAAGFSCSELEAYNLWCRYSDSMAAGWMNLPEEDSEVVRYLESYFGEEDT